MAVRISAPTSGLSRTRRFQAPSASVEVRRNRPAWMARRRASASGRAAALVLPHSSRSSCSDDVRAMSTSRASAPPSTLAASATAAAWGADSSPALAAARATGSVSSRRAVSSTSPAWLTELPVVRAT